MSDERTFWCEQCKAYHTRTDETDMRMHRAKTLAEHLAHQFPSFYKAHGKDMVDPVEALMGTSLLFCSQLKVLASQDAELAAECLVAFLKDLSKAGFIGTHPDEAN